MSVNDCFAGEHTKAPAVALQRRPHVAGFPVQRARAEQQGAADGEAMGLLDGLGSAQNPSRTTQAALAPRLAVWLARAARVPASLTEVTAVAEDGTPLRAWLAMPAGAGGMAPAPLLV